MLFNQYMPDTGIAYMTNANVKSCCIRFRSPGEIAKHPRGGYPDFKERFKDLIVKFPTEISNLKEKKRRKNTWTGLK